MNNRFKEFLYTYVKNNFPNINERNIKNVKVMNSYDLMIEYINGDKYVYDTFSNVRTRVKYKDDYLSDDDIRYEFRTRLKKMMDRRWMSQEQLAKAIGTSQTMVSHYISGKCIPNVIILYKIAKALECSVNDLYYQD